MAERTRNNEIKFFLSDDEKFILDEKWKLSELKSRSDFLRQLIIYSLIPLTRNLRTVWDLPTGPISRTSRLLRLPMQKPEI